MNAIGFETLTVTGTAIGPTSTPGANLALFGPLETAQIRWRADGANPTASVGHLLEIGQVLNFNGELAKLKFIRTGGTSGTLPASYYYASSAASF